MADLEECGLLIISVLFGNDSSDFVCTDEGGDFDCKEPDKTVVELDVRLGSGELLGVKTSEEPAEEASGECIL